MIPFILPDHYFFFFLQVAFQCISSWNFTHIHLTYLFTCRKKRDFFETKKFGFWIFQEVCLHGGWDPKRHTRQRKQLNQSLERNIPFWPHSPRPKSMKEIHCRRYEPAWLRRVLGDGVLYWRVLTYMTHSPSAELMARRSPQGRTPESMNLGAVKMETSEDLACTSRIAC